eukprot:jgi/Tetstr1/454931/TSEL_041792.t1
MQLELRNGRCSMTRLPLVLDAGGDVVEFVQVVRKGLAPRTPGNSFLEVVAGAGRGLIGGHSGGNEVTDVQTLRSSCRACTRAGSWC